MLLCREREGESQLVKLVRATGKTFHGSRDFIFYVAVSASRQLIDDDAERVTWPPSFYVIHDKALEKQKRKERGREKIHPFSFELTPINECPTFISGNGKIKQLGPYTLNNFASSFHRLFCFLLSVPFFFFSFLFLFFFWVLFPCWCWPGSNQNSILAVK